MDVARIVFSPRFLSLVWGLFALVSFGLFFFDPEAPPDFLVATLPFPVWIIWGTSAALLLFGACRIRGMCEWTRHARIWGIVLLAFLLCMNALSFADFDAITRVVRMKNYVMMSLTACLSAFVMGKDGVPHATDELSGRGANDVS